MKRLILILILMAPALMLGASVHELVVISDCTSDNMAPARNISAGKLDDRWNRRTVFAETLDGSKGYKLIFEHPGENMLRRGDRIKFEEKGCYVSEDSASGETVFSGVRAYNVLSAVHNGIDAIPYKERRIDELTDADINTFVTLKDLDIIFKDGSWSNIQESFVASMDACATLVRDINGKSIYVLVNTAVPWRRTGASLPQGNIDVSGIVVRETMRRYGPDMGKFSIRPVDADGIVKSKAKSPWTTIVGWMKPEGSGQSLDFEINGRVDGLFKKGIVNDRIYNDIGSSTAYLWTDSGAEVRVYSGYNSVSKGNNGFVANGAIMLIAPTVSWYEWDNAGNVSGSKAIYVSFSTVKCKSGMLQMNLEWSAGTQDGNKCWYFPIDWKVEYSADSGKNWIVVPDATTRANSIMLHSVPWGTAVIKGSGHDFKMQPCFDTAMGPQQHSFNLPDSALGVKELMLRISPSSKWVAKHRVNVVDSYRDAEVSKVRSDLHTWIRVEGLKIDYRK